MFLLKYFVQKWFVWVLFGNLLSSKQNAANSHSISAASHAEDKGVWNRTYIQHFLWKVLVAFLFYCTKGWLILHGSPFLRALRTPAFGRHLEKRDNYGSWKSL